MKAISRPTNGESRTAFIRRKMSGEWQSGPVLRRVTPSHCRRVGIFLRLPSFGFGALSSGFAKSCGADGESKSAGETESWA